MVHPCMVVCKVRIRFRKAGDLRLVSHHDLMRCWERMLRRADLPFRSTAGFNPKPRLVFALSLGLGIVGSQEVAEVELDADLPADEVLERLRRQAPVGLELYEAHAIDARAGAQVRRAGYRMAVPPERTGALEQRAAALLAAAEVWVERSRPQPRRLEIRPYLDAIRALPDAVEMICWVTPNGTARPDEILSLLGLGDLLPGGAVLERFLIELIDESPEITNPSALRNNDPPNRDHTGPQTSDGPAVASAAQRPRPLTAGPLDF
ncbi:MAG: DUF2344 domain-containing protein [Planctomycetia bacterium]|nr:DUF2344 domain-containing protein [Planctomycetia bacterium]